MAILLEFALLLSFICSFPTIWLDYNWLSFFIIIVKVIINVNIMKYSSSASLATAPLITLLALAHFGTATPQAPTTSADDSTPTSSLPQGSADWVDRGCYVDNNDAKPLMQQKMGNGAGDVFLTPAKCQNLCFLSGFNFAGLKGGQECWCAKKLSGKEAEDDKCDAPCSGYAKDICGGKGFMSVHEALTGDNDGGDTGEKDGGKEGDAKDNKGDSTKDNNDKGDSTDDSTDDGTKDSEDGQEEKQDNKQGKDNQGDDTNNKEDQDVNGDKSNGNDNGKDNNDTQEKNNQAEEQNDDAEQTSQTSGAGSSQPSESATNEDAESGAVRYRPFFGLI